MTPQNTVYQPEILRITECVSMMHGQTESLLGQLMPGQVIPFNYAD